MYNIFMLENKNILIGITGGIAAYKICELIRLFKKNNANVKVVVTESALEFVTELTLETLSKNKIYTQQFTTSDKKPEHICLCDWADVFVIAPTSANTIGKIANGICDNLLTSLCCAFQKPVILAPAMNTGMWNNTFVQENINKLINNGFKIIEPENGYLACGTDGKGRLASVEKIFDETKKLLLKKEFLKNKNIVITAGGTKENIDPVRYIGNYSSGKMGTAIADAAYELGANVTLIAAFDIDRPYKIINIKSASEMQKAVVEEFQHKNADCLIMSAAISDYKIANASNSKIKKENNEELTLKLIKNPDILSEACSQKKEGQTVIGFCAESENLEEYAKEKLKRKNCDYIVANDISRKDIAFSSDYNEVILIDKNLKINYLKKDTKKNIAYELLGLIYD